MAFGKGGPAKLSPLDACLLIQRKALRLCGVLARGAQRLLACLVGPPEVALALISKLSDLESEPS